MYFILFTYVHTKPLKYIHHQHFCQVTSAHQLQVNNEHAYFSTLTTLENI